MENILLEALKTSSIDFNIDSDEKYQYELIANGEEKIVTRLRKYFEDCDEFIISVAFITMGGISLFLEELKNLENKGIKGKILTGDYLTFTEPKALKKLLLYKNIDLKVATNRKHHTKAYFFRKENIWTLIVGSSNLTQGALTVNFEWNIKVNSLENGKIVKSVLETFNREFDSLKTLTEEDIENYQKKYEQLKKLIEVNNQNLDLDEI
ncbi:phospholipase D-like domain-containing protein, partial [uncultured Fusobacterium sp.]